MKIRRTYLEQVRSAGRVEDLWPLVQKAIELEHATIPPYLCGYFTLKLGTNEEVASIIRSVVVEEMLHFAIACNLLLGLGGAPAIDQAGFVPNYPDDLPFGIGDHLKVHLRKCSIEQIEHIFMGIEKPDDVIAIPTAFIGADRMRSAPEALAVPEEFETIGLFYEFLAQKIQEIDQQEPISWRVTDQNVASRWFPDQDDMFLIDSADKAVKAVNVIIGQGEGTHSTPYDEDGVPAHYYRFQEIVKRRRLVPKPGSEPPYIFGGDAVTLDMSNVWNMDDDPKISKYAFGSASRRRAIQFSYSYTRLLGALHLAFNGHKQRLDDAMGLMYELRLLAQQVLATPAQYANGSANTDGKGTGLSFEYRSANAGL